MAYIVLAILLGFLAMGLIKPEVKYNSEVVVDAPIEEVFTTFNDMDKIKNWIPQITKIETVEEKPEVVGSKYIMTLEQDGQLTEMQEIVTSFQKNKEVGISFEAGIMLKSDVFDFSETPEGTRVTGNHVAKGSTYFARCMFAFFGGMFEEIDQTSLDEFKKYVESQ